MNDIGVIVRYEGTIVDRICRACRACNVVRLVYIVLTDTGDRVTMCSFCHQVIDRERIS
jgi:hypothetical protein